MVGLTQWINVMFFSLSIWYMKAKRFPEKTCLDQTTRRTISWRTTHLSGRKFFSPPFAALHTPRNSEDSMAPPTMAFPPKWCGSASISVANKLRSLPTLSRNACEVSLWETWRSARVKVWDKAEKNNHILWDAASQGYARRFLMKCKEPASKPKTW